MSPESALRRVVNFTSAQRLANREVGGFPSIPEEEERARARIVAHGIKVKKFFREVESGPVEGIEANLDRFERMMGLLMHPEAAQMAQQLYDGIGSDKLAFVVVGSGALGGMWIRDLSGSLHTCRYTDRNIRQDLDLALLYDEGQKPSVRESIDLELKVSSLLRNPNNPDIPYGFRGCDAASVRTRQYPKVTPDNVRDIVLKDPVTLNPKISNYFYLSFPGEVNEQARRLVLEELRKTREENPVDWKIFASELAVVLSKHGVGSILKEKHFYLPGEKQRVHGEESEAELKELRQFFKGIMGSVLLDLIGSIDPNFTH
jgi:hypothetical protein